MNDTRDPATTGCLGSRACGGLGLPHLRGGEGTLRQPRVAEADLDFNLGVPPDARAHRERQIFGN